jgi:hydroxymethylglutaryl-CoA reductase
MSLEKRRKWVAEQAGISLEDVDALSGSGGLTPEHADHMIENVIGVFGLPLGIAQNFRVNGRDVLVPMVIEEPSVVAGASYMARLALSGGGFFATASAPEMIGQMQILDLDDPASARLKLYEHRDELLDAANAVDSVLVKLGGGAREIDVRLIDPSPIGAYLVLHLVYDVRDAMGANAVNTAMERLAPQVEQITGGRVHLRILTNLAERRLARARCTLKLDVLAFDEYSAEQVRDGIIEAWAFAASDPYRAATHNKGIMNGVDAVVIATGNDWRAIEAGAHAYAARGGTYTSLSTWGKDYKPLAGTVDPAVDMKTPVRDQVNKLTAHDYFALLADLMKKNPPAAADAPALERFKEIGLEAGKSFDAAALDRRYDSLVPRLAFDRILLHMTSLKREHGWLFTTKTGSYGTDYLQRAFITAIGLGANLPQDAVYPMSQRASLLRAYDGAQKYEIRFEKGKLPPVKGFWSLTMYDEEMFFVANPINRYSMSVRTDPKFESDGSLVIYIQNESPGADKEANWLPAPKGKFHLMLRLYWPTENDPSILNGSWEPPAVKRMR